jgi:hypothetical protein
MSTRSLKPDETSPMAEGRYFAPANGPPMTRLAVESEDILMEISAGPDGIATTEDLKVLTYVLAMLRDAKRTGAQTSRTVCFDAADFFRATGSAISDGSQIDLEVALSRLRATTISMRRTQGKRGLLGHFGWIDGWQLHVRRDGNDGRETCGDVTVLLGEWIHLLLAGDPLPSTGDRLPDANSRTRTASKSCR